MSKNFILSAARLRRGRWHVLLTCAFTHLNRRHFNRNILGIVGGIGICSAFLSLKETVALFLASSLVGGLLSVSTLSALTKVPDRTVGGSDGMMGLVAFCLCREDREDLLIPPYLLKCICAAIVLREMVGVSRLVLYGKITSGCYGLVDNVGHAGGALTGIAACVFMQHKREAQASISGIDGTGSERPEAESSSQHMMEDGSS